MRRPLAVYLLVTGVGAFVALALPSLVLCGFFLLIVPGLVLSLMPTAFLWGVIFAASWRCTRSFLGGRRAIAAASALTAAVLVAIPLPSRVAGAWLLHRTVLPDVTSPQPLRPRGDVRLDLAQPRWDNLNPRIDGRRVWSCDNLCLALLFAPGVTSVTVNDAGPFTPEQHRAGVTPLTAGARTYRLLPKARCGGRGVRVDLVGRIGLFGETLDEDRAIDAEWKLRLASEVCVVAEPAIERADTAIRHGSHGVPADEPRFGSRWSLTRSPAHVSYVELRDGDGVVLLRRLISRVSVLAWPLHVAPSGGLENFHFGFGRDPRSNAEPRDDVELVRLLAAHTTLADRAPPADLLPRIRVGLAAAVADPAVLPEDPIFATLEAYLQGIAGGAPRGAEVTLAEEDLALVEALLLDPRVTDPAGLWHLNAVAPEQHRRLRATIVRRLTDDPNRTTLRHGLLSRFLFGAPPDAYASLSAEERRLLEDADRRAGATGLIARLSDGGAAHVPLLLDLLDHHGSAADAAVASRETATERSQRLGAHRSIVGAARIALCRLGPAAAPALPRLDRMIADGTLPARWLEGHDGSDWNLVRVRLGEPLDRIRKPDRLSGSDADHRRNLQLKLERFHPERSCGTI